MVIKTKFRARINLEPDLRLHLTEIQPDIRRICSDKKQSHTSHWLFLLVYIHKAGINFFCGTCVFSHRYKWYLGYKSLKTVVLKCKIISVSVFMVCSIQQQSRISSFVFVTHDNRWLFNELVLSTRELIVFFQLGVNWWNIFVNVHPFIASSLSVQTLNIVNQWSQLILRTDLIDKERCLLLDRMSIFCKGIQQVFLGEV